MSFNPDPSKQAQEVIFSRKIKKLPHSSLVFNNNNVLQTSSQKHLGVTLDVKLTFDEHFNNVLNKINKTIGLLRKQKIYQELGFESFWVRRWYRKLCLFYKALNNEQPQYLFNLIPIGPTLYPTSLKIRFFHVLSLNGTNLILALEKLRVCRFLRLTSLSSYGHLQTLSTNVIILKDLNLLLDSG